MEFLNVLGSWSSKQSKAGQSVIAVDPVKVIDANLKKKSESVNS